jgi:hypothetical protein
MGSVRNIHTTQYYDPNTGKLVTPSETGRKTYLGKEENFGNPAAQQKDIADRFESGERMYGVSKKHKDTKGITPAEQRLIDSAEKNGLAVSIDADKNKKLYEKLINEGKSPEDASKAVSKQAYEAAKERGANVVNKKGNYVDAFSGEKVKGGKEIPFEKDGQTYSRYVPNPDGREEALIRARQQYGNWGNYNQEFELTDSGKLKQNGKKVKLETDHPYATKEADGVKGPSVNKKGELRINDETEFIKGGVRHPDGTYTYEKYGRLKGKEGIHRFVYDPENESWKATKLKPEYTLTDKGNLKTPGKDGAKITGKDGEIRIGLDKNGELSKYKYNAETEKWTRTRYEPHKTGGFSGSVSNATKEASKKAAEAGKGINGWANKHLPYNKEITQAMESGAKLLGNLPVVGPTLSKLTPAAGRIVGAAGTALSVINIGGKVLQGDFNGAAKDSAGLAGGLAATAAVGAMALVGWPALIAGVGAYFVGDAIGRAIANPVADGLIPPKKEGGSGNSGQGTTVVNAPYIGMPPNNGSFYSAYMQANGMASPFGQ